MSRSRWTEAILAVVVLAGCLGKLSFAAEPETPFLRPPRGAQTMPELLKLAKKDERARVYLYEYLLDHEIFFAVENSIGVEDPDMAHIRVASDGSALIYTSQRALFGAGERAGWRRSEGEGFPYAAVHGQDAFLILFSNGLSRAILNHGDGEEFVLEAADIEELSDGRIPQFLVTGANPG